MSGEVLSDSAELRVPHSREERARKRGHHVGGAMKRTVADHRAHPAAEIEHRREAEVDTARA